jgi:glucokinase
MRLAIEIGGTKLQVAVGAGDRPELLDLVRGDVRPGESATDILAHITQMALPLIERHHPTSAGIGFGGPIDSTRGRTVKSHHVSGWEDYPLAQWCLDTLSLPAVIGNDADVAGLAEARFGSGRGKNPVFYITIGTGIGGGLIVDGQIYNGKGGGAAELGHLRPGLDATESDDILEARAAGWGIAEQMRRQLAATPGHAADEIRELVQGKLDHLTTKDVATAAINGNPLAGDVLNQAWRALGWGIAQMITLLSPEVVVIGGGVSLIGEELLFVPLRNYVNQYVFPPFRGTFEVVAAELGEEMVLYGALALAQHGEKTQG